MSRTSLAEKISKIATQSTKVAAVAVVVTLSTATASMAASVSYSNTTVGGPTWQRPVEGGPSLSGIGTNVNYHLQAFFVDTSGAYDFLSEQDYDGYLHLYESSFNPLEQLTNLIAGNDDFPIIGLSGFNGVALTTGLQYFLVTSAFANGEVGNFTNTISGIGNITLGEISSTPIPTPALLPGLIGIGIAALRKAKQEVEA